MTIWLIAAAVLLLGLIPCGAVALRADVASAVVAMQLGSVVITLVLVMLSVGYGRSPYADVALMLALLSFPSGMVFVRFLERWR